MRVGQLLYFKFEKIVSHIWKAYASSKIILAWDLFLFPILDTSFQSDGVPREQSLCRLSYVRPLITCCFDIKNAWLISCYFLSRSVI